MTVALIYIGKLLLGLLIGVAIGSGIVYLHYRNTPYMHDDE